MLITSQFDIGGTVIDYNTHKWGIVDKVEDAPGPNGSGNALGEAREQAVYGVWGR